ncbi:hypothetical protein FO507_07510 [Bacillus mojavensis]|uniref:hypothetical protein n=1 Tax=Bacillus TaxID=1386 RepID=UPI00028895DF|nr:MULTISPECIES: hypothetical protein [Bacillus]MDI6565588.1 hypothetical protein [Bacillus subtilis]MDR4227213.1 hypothetical protein [Bacillus mojavensis]MEC3587872.1 hypothetical protein [Bacillus mojavensis]MEC5244159.1 hypothetical protein [Bacillus mojavensis]MED0750417.1 hypothetical protein [Bacillus mojavensis]
MMKKFGPKKVKLHWHGVAFDTGLPIHEVSDAWLMSPDIIGKYMGDDELAFYEVDSLERQDDGFHLYEDNHPRFFTVGTSKVGTDLSKINFPELANMSFMDYIRIGFSLEREGSR